MKQLKIFSLIAFVCTASAFAGHATTVTVQPATLNFNLAAVVEPVPKDDDQNEPDDGYECEHLYPFCEANRRDLDKPTPNVR